MWLVRPPMVEWSGLALTKLVQVKVGVFKIAVFKKIEHLFFVFKLPTKIQKVLPLQYKSKL